MPIDLFARVRRQSLKMTLLSAGACLLIVAACSPGQRNDEPSMTEGPQEGIPVTVDRGQGGSVLVFVDVWINEQGPFVFAIDTGASRTVIEPELAGELGLPETDTNVEIITGSGSAARFAEVENWRIGDVALPTTAIIAMPLPQTANLGEISDAMGSDALASMRGLLGSDVLSEFGAITLDYSGERLILRPESEATATP